MADPNIVVTQENENLKRMLTEERARAADLEKRLAAAESSGAANLRTELDALSRVIDVLQKDREGAAPSADTSKEANALRVEAEKLKKALEAFRHEYAEVLEKSERTRITSLSKAAGEQEQLRGELERVGSELAAVSSERDELRELLSQAKPALEAANKRVDALRAANTERERLRAELDAERHRLKRAQEEIAHLSADTVSSEEIDRLTQELADANRLREVAEAEVKRLSDRMMAMESEAKPKAADSRPGERGMWG